MMADFWKWCFSRPTFNPLLHLRVVTPLICVEDQVVNFDRKHRSKDNLILLEGIEHWTNNPTSETPTITKIQGMSRTELPQGAWPGRWNKDNDLRLYTWNRTLYWNGALRQLIDTLRGCWSHLYYRLNTHLFFYFFFAFFIQKKILFQNKKKYLNECEKNSIA